MPTRIPLPVGSEGPVISYGEPPADWSGWRSERGLLEGLVDKAKRGFNTLFDAVVGETPEERMQTMTDSLAMTNPAAVGVTTLKYAGRHPAVRAGLIRELGEQIDQLPAGSGQDMLRELVVTHPRVMAAFQHAGGRFRSVDDLGQDSRGRLEGLFQPGPYQGRKGLVSGLRRVYQGPEISFQSDKGALRDVEHLANAGGLDELPRIPGHAPHEITHWAQQLGSGGAKRRQRIVEGGLKAQEEAKSMRDYRLAIDRLEDQRDLVDDLTRQAEAGAERAEINQLQRLRRRNSPLYDSFIGRGLLFP